MQKLKGQFNIGVALSLLLMLIAGLFVMLQSVEKTSLAQSKHALLTDKKNEESLYTSIPERAVAIQTLTSYKEPDLKTKAGELPAQTQLDIQALTDGVFKLSNGTFVQATKAKIASDVLLSKNPVNQEVYTKNKTVKVFYNPFTTFDNQVYSQLSGVQALAADKKAMTHWGTYYEVSFNGGQTGWVSAADLTMENPKMLALQQLLNQKYNKSNYSIYVKELDSDFTVGVNPNEKMYSASLSKLPILYWTQKQINAGKANLTDQLHYTAIINKFPGSFDPAGTGTLPEIPNGEDYSLLDVINRTAKESDNVGSNLLAYYETGQFSPEFQAAITKIAGQAWNPSEREASASMVGKVLEALYNEGGASFNALFNTAFDGIKIEAGVPGNVRVAHKIGDADSYNHDAAIVFAKEPYILVIETNGGSDDLIKQISKDVYGALQQ